MSKHVEFSIDPTINKTSGGSLDLLYLHKPSDPPDLLRPPFVAPSIRLSDCKLAICPSVCLSLSAGLCLAVLPAHLLAICLSVCKYVTLLA